MYAERISRLLIRANDRANAEDRIVACDLLVREGEIALARPALESLRDHPNVGAVARRLLSVCGQLDRWGIVGKLQRFVHRDDLPTSSKIEAVDFERDSSALVARRPGAQSVLFIFTGDAKMLWVSLHVLHQIVERFDCHVVYLRDFSGLGYFGGVGGFGSDYKTCVARMSDLAADLGAPRLHVIGNSGGGYAAMRYAYDLKADGVLVFSPAMDAKEVAVAMGDNSETHIVPDLVEVYASAEAPRATLVFGEAHSADAARCGRFAGLPKVRLAPILGYDRHDILAHVLAEGAFPLMLGELLETRRAG